MILDNVNIVSGAQVTPLPPAGMGPAHQITNTTPTWAVYRSHNGNHLVVDLNDPDLQSYADGVFRAPSGTPSPILPGTAMTMAHDIYMYVRNHPSTHPTNAVRNAFYTRTGGTALLGGCFRNTTVLCRERSFMLHVMLTQAGIPSQIVIGTDPATSHGHTWVRYASAANQIVMDPEQHHFIVHAPLSYLTYTYNIQTLVLTTPTYLRTDLP